MRIKLAVALLASFSILAGPAMALDASMKARINPNLLTKIPLQKAQVLPFTVANKGCTVYENINNSGASWRMNVAYKTDVNGSQITYRMLYNKLGSFWNDKISSIACDDTANVKCMAAIYQDVNKGGDQAIIWPGEAVPPQWNDRISSIEIFCTQLH